MANVDLPLKLTVVIGLNPLYLVHLETSAPTLVRASHSQVEAEDGATLKFTFLSVRLIPIIIFFRLSHVIHQAQIAATVLKYCDYQCTEKRKGTK